MISKENIIQITLIILCFLAAISGFTLSFTNLKDLAEKAGISPTISFLFPIGIDIFILISDIAILHYSLKRKKSYGSWALLSFFTTISIIYNMANSYDGLLYQSIHAMPIITQIAALKVISGLILTNNVDPHSPTQECDLSKTDNTMKNYLISPSIAGNSQNKSQYRNSNKYKSNSKAASKKRRGNVIQENMPFSDQKTLMQF